MAQVVQNLPANAGNIRGMGWISRSGRSPGGGNGKYSCLENSMDRRAWHATVCGAAKSQTHLKQLSTHMHAQLEQIMDHKIQRDQKTWLPLLKNWEQKQGTVHAPALSTTKGMGKPCKPPLQPDPLDTPTLTPFKEPTHSASGRKQGNLLLDFGPPATAGDPIKPCLNFLPGF